MDKLENYTCQWFVFSEHILCSALYVRCRALKTNLKQHSVIFTNKKSKNYFD